MSLETSQKREVTYTLKVETSSNLSKTKKKQKWSASNSVRFFQRLQDIPTSAKPLVKKDAVSSYYATSISAKYICLYFHIFVFPCSKALSPPTSSISLLCQAARSSASKAWTSHSKASKRRALSKPWDKFWWPRSVQGVQSLVLLRLIGYCVELQKGVGVGLKCGDMKIAY